MSSDRRRATIADVARQAGVSPATAGRALGDYGYVRAEIRTRVREAAEMLGYRANGLARSMITGRTNTIGVVGADIGNPFFASAVRGIGDVARAKGYGTILTNSDEDVAIEREAVKLLLEKQVDGIIVSPADVSDSRHLHQAIESGTPVILLDRAVSDLAADVVLTDTVTASKTAVSHLLKLGHRRIAIVAELRASMDSQWRVWLDRRDVLSTGKLNPSGSRLLGYIQAHETANVPIDPDLIRATGAYSRVSAREQTSAVLALTDPPTALFTADNVMTVGALDAVQQNGLRIPDDISFVAYDDMDWMTFLTPSISAVAQPVYEMGQAAAHMLLERMEKPNSTARRTVLKAKFVKRQSCARISR
jgi:LacI family transcriptional regulator